MGYLSEIFALIRKNIRDYGMYIAFVAIIIIFTLLTDGIFISSRNISNLIDQTGYIAVLAVGMTLVIIIRHIDLSVGFVAGFMGAIVAIMMTEFELSEWIAIPAVLLIGATIGLIYGSLISKIGVPAFVVTLAGMLIFRGLLLFATEGTGTIIIPNEGFNALGNEFIPDIIESEMHILTLVIGAIGIILFIISQNNSRNDMIKYGFEVISKPIFIVKLVFISAIIGVVVFILAGYNGLSWTIVIMMIVVLIYNFLMTKTTLGRHIYGVGGNPEAAELSGINVSKITLFVFSSMGALAALSGVLYAARLQSATTTAGTAFELDAIAAAYVGGVSASGGVGKVTGSIIGALVMSSLTNGMNLMGMGISLQYVIRGLILVFAVIFDITTRKRSAKAV